MIRSLAIAITGTLLLSGAANATYLDFTGWDADQINSTGQQFVDVYKDVDLFVRSTGDIEPSSADHLHITLEGNSNEQVFAFSFSSPLDLQVELHTLDPNEYISINSANEFAYQHVNGRQPIIDRTTFQGTGFGLTPDGVTNGLVKLGETSSFLLSYEAIADLKFEQLSIGVVPEPNSTGLVMIGMLGLMLFRRRK